MDDQDVLVIPFLCSGGEIIRSGDHGAAIDQDDFIMHIPGVSIQPHIQPSEAQPVIFTIARIGGYLALFE
jgi:hypothetical protein